jgi:hypothetical protein
MYIFIYPLLIKLINKVVYIFWMLRLGHPPFRKNHLAQVKNSAAKILVKQSETKMMLEKPWSLATTSAHLVAVASAISGEVILQMPSLPLLLNLYGPRQQRSQHSHSQKIYKQGGTCGG